MDTFISSSAADTLALGERWGREAQAGWVFGLTGPLGAGKTQLVRGIARGLGAVARVRSPTFILVHEYNGGRCPLFHLDLYRLDTLDRFESAGLRDYLFTPEGITAIEWFEHWPKADLHILPARSDVLLRRAVIEVLGEHRRRITYEDSRP